IGLRDLSGKRLARSSTKKQKSPRSFNSRVESADLSETFLWTLTSCQFLVGVDWMGSVAARCDDAGGVHRCPVQPQPGHVQVRAAAPTVAYGVVDLRDVTRGGIPASVEIKFT